MHRLIALLTILLLLPGAARAADALSRDLDAEEVFQSLPDITSGIVYRAFTGTLLMGAEGPLVVRDLTVVLAAPAGTTTGEYFDEAVMGDTQPSFALVYAEIDGAFHGELGLCGPVVDGETTIECVIEGDGGGFRLDRAIAAPHMTLTITGHLRLSDDPLAGGEADVRMLALPEDAATYTVVVPVTPASQPVAPETVSRDE